jgi:para-nitrobenzyl esterase
MQEAWIAFARTGDPNTPDAVTWPRYDTATRPTLELGDEVKVVADPSKEMRELWYRTSVPR